MRHEEALQAAGTIRKIESVDVITQSASLFNVEAVVRAYLEARLADPTAMLKELKTLWTQDRFNDPEDWNVSDEWWGPRSEHYGRGASLLARTLLADFGDTTA